MSEATDERCVACGCEGFRLSAAGRCDGCEAARERAHWWNKGAQHERHVMERDLAVLAALSTPKDDEDDEDDGGRFPTEWESRRGDTTSEALMQLAAAGRAFTEAIGEAMTKQLRRFGLVLMPSDPNPFPRIHLFRFPRRELVLAVGAVASGLVAARYGLSWSEASLVAGPLVGGWVLSEVMGS